MADDVQVKFGAQIQGVVDGIDQIKDKIGGMNDSVGEAAASFAEFGEKLVEALAIDQIAEFVGKYAELGEMIERTSRITGISTDQVQLFSTAIKLSGGDSEAAAMTLSILQKNIGDAISKAGPARAAFEGMGFSLQQLKNTDIVTLLFEMKERMDQAGTSAEQSALKMEYMRTVAGRQGAQFLALKDSLEEVKKVVAETGSSMSPGQTKQAAELEDDIKKLSLSYTGLSETIASKVMPIFDGIVTSLKSVIEWTNNAIKANDALIQSDLAAERKGQANRGHPAVRVPDNAPGASKDYGEQFGPKEAHDYGVKFGPPTNPLPQLDTGKEDGSGEKNDIAIEKSDLAEQLEMYKLDEQAKKLADQAKVDSGQMSNQQMLSDLKASLEGEKQAALNEISGEQALYDQDSAEWEELHNKKLVIAKQYDNALLQLQLDSAKKQQEAVKQEAASITQAFEPVERAMDGALQGILQGTQSVTQAMRRLFGDMVSSVLEDIAKMALRWSAFEASSAAFGAGDSMTKALGAAVPSTLGGTQQNSALNAALTKLAGIVGLNTAAHTTGTVATTGNTAATAAGAAAATASATATTAGTLATSVNTTTTASSGVLHVAAMAENTLATAANTIATWAGDAVKSLIPLATCAWNIPSDMPAFLHAGEMVVPADTAAAIRGGGGFSGGAAGSSGGGNYTININAIDTQTGAQFLKQNAGIIAQTLSSQARNFNPSLRAS